MNLKVLHLSTHHQILIPTLLVLDGWREHNMVANQEMAASLPTKRDDQGIRNINIIPFLDITIGWMDVIGSNNINFFLLTLESYRPFRNSCPRAFFCERNKINRINAKIVGQPCSHSATHSWP